MILDQTSGAIQQLSTTPGLNAWTWAGTSELAATKRFCLAAAQSYVDGAVKTQSLVDGATEADSLVDGALQTQSGCS